MFEKRLRGYRSLGYARDEAPLGIGPEPDEEPDNDDAPLPTNGRLAF